MADDRIFIDTNILINALVAESPRYFHARGMLSRLENSEQEGWISRQMLREFLAAMSRPQMFSHRLSPKEVIVAAKELERQFHVAEESGLVTEQLYVLLDEIPCGGRQTYDANIVATMLAHGISRLLTYNRADFQRFAGFIDVIETL
jgi:predicted nucleic acid-binding protein